MRSMSAFHKITISIPGRAHDNLVDMARAASMPTVKYAELLFGAAYAARCGATGDRDLDAAVSRVALLFGARDFDTLDIAQRVGMSEAFVDRTISRWRDEVRGHAARAGAA